MSDRTPQQRSTTDQLKLGGAIAAVVALVLFFFQNQQDVEIHFLFFDQSIPMFWMLLLSCVLGGVTVFLVMTLRGWGRKPKGN